MKNIHVVYDDENLQEYLVDKNPVWLDGITPVYILSIPEMGVTSISDDPMSTEDVLDVLKKEDNEEDEDVDDDD